MKRVYFLHGFLGRAADWMRLGPQWPSGWEPIAVDLWADLRGPGDSLEDWAERFCERVSRDRGEAVLVGYSMGGRLAMHALREAPAAFAGAVLVSAHPGLQPNEERAVHVRSDEAWARRFETEPLESVVRDWNAQGVLSASGELPRQERDFDPWKLADSLRAWSVGRQEDLRPVLEELSIPLLWIAGERDTKYAALARELEPRLGRSAPAQVRVIPGAGHRVPWDVPREFSGAVGSFLSDLTR